MTAQAWDQKQTSLHIDSGGSGAMGQGRFGTEELVVDSVGLRPSRIRPRSRDADRQGRALGRGGTESGLEGAGTGRGEAERSWGAELGGVCVPIGLFWGGAAADLGPGRDGVRLEIARALPTLICAGWGVPCRAW